MEKIERWLGVQAPVRNSEQWIATVGGIVSLLGISLLSYRLLGLEGTLAVVPSMGAATVLLFAVPHGPLSQPWALFVGNGVSAVIGVTCVLWIESLILASSVAVGLSMGAMHFLRCIHPPGGATALAAVIGGDAIHELGYGYVFVPVLLNCCVIFLLALAFNNLFGWRRYPSALMRYKPVAKPTDVENVPSREFIEQALRKSSGMVDISVNQLAQLLEQAQLLQQEEQVSLFHFELGGVYTNNKPGADWAVRKIIDYGQHPDPAKSLIIYKVLEGYKKNTTDSCSRTEFALWAQQRLKPLN